MYLFLAAWLLFLIFVYVFPIKRLLAPYNGKQPVYGLVPYVVDDKSVRLAFQPFPLRIFARLGIMRDQRVRPLGKE